MIRLPEFPLGLYITLFCRAILLYSIWFAVNDMIHRGEARVRILTTPDRWHGVTYREDKPAVQQAIRELYLYVWDGAPYPSSIGNRSYESGLDESDSRNRREPEYGSNSG